MYTAIFNPIVRTPKGRTNGWLEELVTSPLMAASNDQCPDDIGTLFSFEDIGDASQDYKIQMGFDKFQSRETPHIRSTFRMSTSEKNALTLHCVAEQDKMPRVEEMMRILFEAGHNGDIDTAYYKPNLWSIKPKNNEYGEATKIGWMESFTGAFVFVDTDTADQFCNTFSIHEPSL